MARDILNREIIKKVMQNFGVLPHPNFGKAGISSEDLLIDKSLKLKDDKNIVTNHKIFAGKIFSKSDIIRSMVADISEVDMSEFIVLFRMDELPIYAIRLAFDNHDYGLFINYLENDEEETWYEADVQNKALVLAATERIAHSGILWEPCPEHDDLYEGLLHIAGLDEA